MRLHYSTFQITSLASIALLFFAVNSLPVSAASLGTTSASGMTSVPTTSTPITPGISVNLHAGAQGQDVKNLQNFLKLYGVLPGSAPLGFYGPLTTQAVRAFQKREHIAPVGNVGLKTLTRILALSKTSLSAVPIATASTTSTMTDAILTMNVGEDGSGTDSSTTFASTTKTIYAVLTLANARQSTQISYIRYRDGAYLDSGVTHMTRSGLRYAHIQWTLVSGETRAIGKYQIRFYVNGNRAKTISYTVQ